MSGPRSDALVFFGVTGDLAYRKIFPSLQAMLRPDDPMGVCLVEDSLRAPTKEECQR